MARRVAGEGKCTATYVKFLEDLGCGGQAARARDIRVLEAGFLDYRMVRVSLGVRRQATSCTPTWRALSSAPRSPAASAWIRACCPAALPFSSIWRMTAGKQ